MMEDYMQRDNELKEHPDAYETFRQIANGDQAVYGLLVSFWNFEHVFDDLIDHCDWDDERKEQAFKALNEFVATLLLNGFVRQYASELRALFTSAIARNIGGDHIEKDPLRKQHAAATRCADIDILCHIAGLHLGWDAMIKLSKQRDVDKEDK